MKEVTKHLAFLGPPKVYSVIDYDVSSKPVSMHTPLQRFLVNLLVETSRYGLELTLKSRIENEVPLANLLEPVLRVVVAVPQVMLKVLTNAAMKISLSANLTVT